jgi:hypothetical protein
MAQKWRSWHICRQPVELFLKMAQVAYLPLQQKICFFNEKNICRQPVEFY